MNPVNRYVIAVAAALTATAAVTNRTIQLVLALATLNLILWAANQLTTRGEEEAS